LDAEDCLDTLEVPSGAIEMHEAVRVTAAPASLDQLHSTH
jgi:hypothetical protein